MFDRSDLEILKILQKNSRASLSEIAKEVKISRPTVKSKIERLAREGIIKGFTIELDREAIEKNITLHVKAKAEFLDKLANELKGMNEILEIYEVMNEKNVSLKAIVKDIEEAKLFLEKLRAAGLKDMECSVALRKIKEKYETEIGPEIGILLECEYCGKEIKDKPQAFKIHNREHYFCCPICLRSYRKKTELPVKVKKNGREI